jgi:hypothetical protein
VVRVQHAHSEKLEAASSIRLRPVATDIAVAITSRIPKQADGFAAGEFSQLAEARLPTLLAIAAMRAIHCYFSWPIARYGSFPVGAAHQRLSRRP